MIEAFREAEAAILNALRVSFSFFFLLFYFLHFLLRRYPPYLN